MYWTAKAPLTLKSNSFWKGAFAPLQKHVSRVTFVEDDDMKPEWYPDPELANEYGFQRGHESRYEDWSDGFFRVSFDKDGHGGGTYYYPAEVQQANAARLGFMPEPDEFYRF